MTKKLTEAFDFDDIEQDEINLENTISGIRILGKIKDSIKNENSYIVRHQISSTFDEFVEFVEKDLPYIVANKESLLDMLASKSQTLNLCASIKDRSIKEYGIGTAGFKETIDKLFSTLKKAFSLLGFSKWQNIGQKIKIKVVWNEMRIPYTGEDYTSANVLRCGVVYSLYKMLLKNIEYVVNTFSFDLKSIIDGGTHQTYIGHFNVFSQYANPAKDNIKKKLKDYYKNAFEDAFTPKDDPYTRITGREFNHILKIGKDFVNLKKSPILFESFDFTEDTPVEDIDSQIEHNKTLALYKSSPMHAAVVEEFNKLKRKQGGYGLPLNVAISEDSLWMVDYIVQDALDIFAEGDIRKFYEERGMCIFFRYCESNVRPFDFSPKVDKFVIDFDNAGMIHNYLESLVNTIKKYEAKWIYDYERYAKFINNLEIKGYDFSNLANLGYYIGFLLDGTLQLTVNGKKFYNFVAFSYIRDEETIEECLDRALWYQQILAEKFTKEELLKFTKDFVRGNKDRKDLSFGLNESFDFDSNTDENYFDTIIESHRFKKFLEENYKITGQVRPYKKNGILFIDIDGDAKVKNTNLTSLTDGRFCFGKIKRKFDCSNCYSLTSLKGAPREVGGNFICYDCTSLESLEGAPEKVGEIFNCDYCISLTSLEGGPKKVGGNFHCSNCDSLTSLKGFPKEVGGNFYCPNCNSLKPTVIPPTTKIKGKIIR